MKKFLLIVPVLLMVLATLYSQDAGKFAAGGRFGAQIGINKAEDDLNNKLDANGLKLEVMPNPNVVVFGAYGFTDNIGMQLELNFQIDQGMSGTRDSGAHKMQMTYSTLDIPLLLKINFLPSQHRFGILAGPYFTTPLGKVKTEYTAFDASDVSRDIDAPSFGITAGLFGGFDISPIGRFVVDVRYLQDFGASKEKNHQFLNGIADFNFMQRRGIVISVGFEYTFK